MDRREFLTGCSQAINDWAGSTFGSLAFSESGDKPIMVVVFLRGGMDGLNLLGPVDDAEYVAARATELRVGADGKKKGIPISNAYSGHDFRLCHTAGGLKELYDSKALALIHASGLPNGTRSHFEAMDLMERGVAKSEFLSLSTGWLTRHMQQMKMEDRNLPAWSIGGNAAAFLGGNAVGGTGSSLQMWGGVDQLKLVEALYQGDTWIHQSGAAAQSAINIIAQKTPRNADGSVKQHEIKNGAKYPGGDFGENLKSLAQLIRMDLGLQVATVDFGGWDHHQYQEYQFENLSGQLSNGLAAFWNDLSEYHSRLNVVVMSEFGRRLKSNQSAGTDHGHGNLMMVLGAKVQGGKCYGSWPGLQTDQLDARADLAITTDYRNVLAELLQKNQGNPDPAKVFVGFEKYKPLGIMV